MQSWFGDVEFSVRDSFWGLLFCYLARHMPVRAPRVAHSKRTHLPMQEMQEMWVRFLGWEDPLEEEMETHSSILAWKIPWTEEPGEL